MTDKILCIYHGNCQDGFGAAWAVRHALGADRVEFHAGIYQDPPPDVAGRHVLIVDFSYKRPMLQGMATAANSITVLDHHKSAMEDLAGFREPASAAQFRAQAIPGYQPYHAIRALFDMNRSGAGIAWDFFHPNQKRPRLIDYIEDRDLWRFALPGTREIAAALFSYPYDLGTWDELMTGDHTRRLREEGVAIERKHHKDIAELVDALWRKMVIGGHVVPVANLPYTLASDAGTWMCRGLDEGLAGSWIPPFAACYWDTREGRVFSLRSLYGGSDVSEIAKLYGGGGHRNAAGFRVPFADLERLGLA